jgi:hypothetical protein
VSSTIPRDANSTSRFLSQTLALHNAFDRSRRCSPTACQVSTLPLTHSGWIRAPWSPTCQHQAPISVSTCRARRSTEGRETPAGPTRRVCKTPTEAARRFCGHRSIGLSAAKTHPVREHKPRGTWARYGPLRATHTSTASRTAGYAVEPLTVGAGQSPPDTRKEPGSQVARRGALSSEES